MFAMKPTFPINLCLLKSNRALLLLAAAVLALSTFLPSASMQSQATVSQTKTTQTSVLPYRDARLPIDERVADLLSRMTIDEKVAQLVCLWGEKPQAKPQTDF